MLWTALAVAAALIVGGLLYWRRRRRRVRLVSIVGLLREPITLDPAVLAHTAGRAWNAELGDGESEGPDGFVAGGGPMSTILHEQRMFLINCLPSCYVEDVEETARGITDLRIRSLFQEHQAWFSCDALGVDHATPDDEVREWYRRLGKLFAELIDDNFLLIFVPETSAAFPINEDTEAALRSDDPPRALHETLTAPIVEVSADDPRVQRAVETARARWPEFVAAFDAQAGLHFAAKAPVSHSGNTEFIWITVTSVEGERIYGTLANDPANLGPLKLGSRVSVQLADLNDWCYQDAAGKLVGGFTIDAVTKASRRKRSD